MTVVAPCYYVTWAAIHFLLVSLTYLRLLSYLLFAFKSVTKCLFNVLENVLKSAEGRQRRMGS